MARLKKKSVSISSMKGNKSTLQGDRHSVRTLIGVKGKGY